MKTILAFGLTAALFSVSPAFADGSTNPLCGPDAPDSHKRPGGYWRADLR